MTIHYAPLTRADRAAFFRLTGEEQVAATMRFDCPRTQAESDQILETYLAPGNHTFALRFEPDGEMWGVFAFKGSGDTADLSQMQSPAQWGKGLGEQVLKDMIALVRREGWYRALEGYVLASNTASCRMAQRSGFHEKERRRYPGMTEDLIIYRLEL